MLYDKTKFQREIFFDELSVGQTFPPLQYRFGSEDVATWLRSVDDDTPAFRDDGAARTAGFEGALVPSLAAMSYGFIYQSMGRRPPTGNLNTRASFEFLAPIRHGTSLTMNLSVEDKFVKRERNYVVFKGVVRDDGGQDVAIVRAELTFPK